MTLTPEQALNNLVVAIESADFKATRQTHVLLQESVSVVKEALAPKDPAPAPSSP